MDKFIHALPDSLLVAGAACVAYGAWLFHPAAGYIVGGVLLLAGGVQAGRNAAQKAAE
jgi:hypothetical protein